MNDSRYIIEQQRQITQQLCQDTGARYIPTETVSAGMDAKTAAICAAHSSRDFWEALQRPLSLYVYDLIGSQGAEPAQRVA